MSDFKRRLKAVQAVLWADRIVRRDVTGQDTGGFKIPPALSPDLRERVILKAIGDGGYLTRGDIQTALDVPLPSDPTDEEVDVAMTLVPRGWRGRLCRAGACACMGCVGAGLRGLRISEEAWERWQARHPDGGPSDDPDADDPYAGVDPLTLPLSERLRRRKAKETP